MAGSWAAVKAHKAPAKMRCRMCIVPYKLRLAAAQGKLFCDALEGPPIHRLFLHIFHDQAPALPPHPQPKDWIAMGHLLKSIYESVCGAS
jgi:hypothetical protein